MFLPHPRVKVSIVGSLCDREVACSASDRQGSNFESCVWRAVSSQSSHHPQEALLAQFSLYVHKGGLKPDSFHLLPAHTGRRLHGVMSSIIIASVFPVTSHVLVKRHCGIQLSHVCSHHISLILTWAHSKLPDAQADRKDDTPCHLDTGQSYG